MSETLGKKLKELRSLASLTLREVELATNISNAYLSQLENDLIKRPSAQCLYTLAKLYAVDVETLLKVSGLINDEQQQRSLLFRIIRERMGTLTPYEEDELLKYLRFLRFKKEN